MVFTKEVIMDEERLLGFIAIFAILMVVCLVLGLSIALIFG